MELRDYQKQTIDQLRQSLQAGKKRPVVQAPTGAGKTVIAAALVNMARDRGKRVIFTVPFLSLINQTVERFFQNGIYEVGVMQGDHGMTNPNMPVQVCSVQTLARRNIPKADLVIVDECHNMFKIYDKWMNDPDWVDVPFIGLTATPWAKGMGKKGRWDDLIVCTTTTKLIDQKALSDFKVFAPAHPDLSGVQTVAGDYKLDQLASVMDRATLVADIIKTWLQRAANRPTVAFCVDRSHAKHVEQQFLASGVPAAYMDAFTKIDDRDAIIARFKAGEIKVLCNVGVLTTGFDADVRCVILARPTKSEILYTQMIGRGLRQADGKDHCILHGSKVLTDKGEVNIEDVTLDHKVWDGVSFVKHGGAVCRGVQPVMQYAGITATSDHRVMTNDGWQTLAEAHRRQLWIAVTGVNGEPVRFFDDCEQENVWQFTQVEGGGQVRQVRENALGIISQHQKAPEYAGLPPLQWPKKRFGSEVGISALPSSTGSVQQFIQRLLCSVWRAWDSVFVSVTERCRYLDCSEFGACFAVNAIGPDRQQWQLRAGEPSLDRCRGQHEQYSQKQRCKTEICGVSGGVSLREVCGFYSEKAYFDRHDRSANSRTMGAAFKQAEGEVWDILNAGPLQRFTANGRLVHNCLILDHSDTTLKLGFVTDIHHDKLDDGTVNRKAAVKREALPKECPKCTFLRPPRVSECPSCGFKPERVSQIECEDGDLYEISRSRKASKALPIEEKKRFYAELLRHAYLRGYKNGWAYHAYKDRFGVGPANTFPTTPSIDISHDTQSWITYRNIRQAKSKGKAA